MLNISIGVMLVVIVGCVGLGIALTILTDNFTNFDGLFEYSQDDHINEKLDALYDMAILNEGYYKHGKTSRENYIKQLKELQKEVNEIEREIKEQKENNIG